jgi:Na+/melibiose symporter-like transporter
MKYIWIVLIVLIALFSIFPSNSANIQDVNTEKEIRILKNRVSSIEYSVSQNKTELDAIADVAQNNALSLILFAFFCAWWAKTSGRSSLLWFILGLFFHIFTAIALVIKTERKT